MAGRERCGNCALHFHDPPAAIVTPIRGSDTVGFFGSYCSFNCAKRALFDLRVKPWFTLLAITALKLGATLPIKMSERGKPPQQEEKQVVSREKLDCFDKKIIYRKSIVISQLPATNPSAKAEEEEGEEEEEPIAFESVSGIQSFAVMGV